MSTPPLDLHGLFFTLLYCLGEGLYFQEFYVQFGLDCSLQVKYHHTDVYPKFICATCHVQGC